MRSVCGLSARSKQIMALKYNPSSLPLTASNLKESNVGKIICQGTIESSRRGTCLFFHCSCITMRINGVMIYAFEVTESSALSVTTMRVEHSEGKAEFLPYFERVVHLAHLQPSEGRLDSFITCFCCFKGFFWFITFGFIPVVLAIIAVSNYNVGLFKIIKEIWQACKKGKKHEQSHDQTDLK